MNVNEMTESLKIMLEPRIEEPSASATLEEHMAYLAELRRHAERFALARAKEVCESPIEQIVFLYLWYASFEGGGLTFVPQKEIGPYRVDFLVYLEDRKLVVECDGHDFHEKTKQQAARDKKRDRYLASQGYTVLHFTGSEIKRDPYQVIRDINDVVYTEMIHRDLGY